MRDRVFAIAENKKLARAQRIKGIELNNLLNLRFINALSFGNKNSLALTRVSGGRFHD